MTGADKAYADVVREVFAIKGIDVLLDAKLLANCVRDIAGTSWSKEYTIAERNLDQDMLEAFHEAAHKGEREVQAVTRSVTERLRYDCALTQAMAESISYGMGAAVSGYIHDEGEYAEGEQLLALGDYVGALRVFSNLGAHKDAADRASECAEYVKRDRAYEKAKKEFSNAIEEGQFKKLAKAFDSLDGYRASAKWKRKCLSSADKAREAERTYQEAKSILLDDALTAEQYQNGAQLFKRIEWYKDSAKGSEACERLASEAASYEKAAAAIESPSSTGNLKEAICVLESLGTFRDSAKLLKDAKVEHEKLCNYELACEAESKAAKQSDYENASQLFKALGDYRDAAERAGKNAAHAEMLRRRALKRRENSYREAVDRLSQARSPEDYEQALKQLKRLAGYRDADELIAKCQFRIDELIRERHFDLAKKALDASFSSAGFSEVESMFRRLGDFGEAAKYAEEARRRSEEAAKEERYQLASTSMGNASCTTGYESAAEYKRAAKCFDELGDYKDSQHKAQQCREESAVQRLIAEWEEAEQDYQRATKQMESSSTEDDYKEAAAAFRLLAPFKDAVDMANACDGLAEACREAAEEKRIEEEYSNAVEECSKLESESPTEKSYLDLAKRFEGLGDYKDSERRGEECRVAAENVRKNQVLADANCLLEEAKNREIASIQMSRIREAIESLESIGEWKNAEALTIQCKELLSKKYFATSAKQTSVSNNQWVSVVVAPIVILAIIAIPTLIAIHFAGLM